MASRPPGAGRRFGLGHQGAPQSTAQERALHVQPEHLGAAHARNRAMGGKGDVHKAHRVPARCDEQQLDIRVPQPPFEHLGGVDRGHLAGKGVVDALGCVGVEKDLRCECAEGLGVGSGCSAVLEIFGHGVWNRYRPGADAQRSSSGAAEERSDEGTQKRSFWAVPCNASLGSTALKDKNFSIMVFNKSQLSGKDRNKPFQEPVGTAYANGRGEIDSVQYWWFGMPASQHNRTVGSKSGYAFIPDNFTCLSVNCSAPFVHAT